MTIRKTKSCKRKAKRTTMNTNKSKLPRKMARQKTTKKPTAMLTTRKLKTRKTLRKLRLARNGAVAVPKAVQTRNKRTTLARHKTRRTETPSAQSMTKPSHRHLLVRRTDFLRKARRCIGSHCQATWMAK